MSNLNQCNFQGNLTDVPKLMGKDNNVARFTIAVNNGFGDRKTTLFLDCVAFGKQVDVIMNNLTKGKQILVRGKMMPNSWEDKETGQKRTRFELHLEQYEGFFFTGNKNDNAPAAASSGDEISEPVKAAAGGGDTEELF